MRTVSGGWVFHPTLTSLKTSSDMDCVCVRLHLDVCMPVCVLRLAALWEEEQRSKGSRASLCSVVWTFCRARFLLSILCLTVTQLAGFSGPVCLK